MRLAQPPRALVLTQGPGIQHLGQAFLKEQWVAVALAKST